VPADKLVPVSALHHLRLTKLKIYRKDERIRALARAILWVTHDVDSRSLNAFMNREAAHFGGSELNPNRWLSSRICR
jgi:hypothetical protein